MLLLWLNCSLKLFNFCAQEIVGNIGGKLHTGRSRNDQVFWQLNLQYNLNIPIITVALKLAFHEMCDC